eukprot:1328577-Amorphochlora_amoeboformis.AAC.1
MALMAVRASRSGKWGPWGGVWRAFSKKRRSRANFSLSSSASLFPLSLSYPNTPPLKGIPPSRCPFPFTLRRHILSLSSSVSLFPLSLSYPNTPPLKGIPPSRYPFPFTLRRRNQLKMY